jgi:hypothetical protein
VLRNACSISCTHPALQLPLQLGVISPATAPNVPGGHGLHSPGADRKDPAGHLTVMLAENPEPKRALSEKKLAVTESGRVGGKGVGVGAATYQHETPMAWQPEPAPDNGNDGSRVPQCCGTHLKHYPR